MILLRKHPNTKLLTCSRKGAQLLNDLALEGNFPGCPPLAIFSGDVESDPANYDDEHHVKESCELEPSELKNYKGMQVYMTKNVWKEMGFVNECEEKFSAGTEFEKCTGEDQGGPHCGCVAMELPRLG